jgi:hypothetical protein
VHTSGVPIPASAGKVQSGPSRYSRSAALSSVDRVVPNCAPSWPTSAEFDRYPFTPADEASMTKLLGVK